MQYGPEPLFYDRPREAGGGRDRAELVGIAHDRIRHGSKSFSAASRLFDRATRERVWLLYAWCRRCDDIADAQELGGELGAVDEADAGRRLATIRSLTQRALGGLPTSDPAFDAFGLVARETGITSAMADDVVAGFALDAEDWRPRSTRDLMRYCYHVAGAVGVMMAVVMGVSPHDDDTLDRACDLGFAFQLANIARDVEEDDAAGRCYLPVEWLVEADIAPGEHMKPHYRGELVAMAAQLAAMARTHERAARVGTARLAFRQRWAVLAAAGIYGGIATRVARRGAHAWDSRTRTSRVAKAAYVARALAQALGPTPTPAVWPDWSRRDFAGGQA